MKKHLFIIFLGIIVVSGLILISNCGKEEDVIINDKVKFPEENSELLNVIVKGDTLNFIYKSGSSKPQFNQGDIVVGQKDGGYLKEVLSTTTKSDTLVLITEQSALTDVVEKGIIDTTFSLSLQGQQMSPIYIDTIIIGSSGKKYQLNFSGGQPILIPMGEVFEIRIPDITIEIMDGGNVAVSVTIDTLILSKSVDVDLNLEIDDSEIINFRMVANGSDDVGFKGVTMDILQSISDDIEIKLTTLNLGTIVIWIGPLPVVFVFEFGIYAGVDAAVTVSAANQVTNNVNLNATNEIGAEYTEGSWESIWNNTLNGNADWNYNPSGSISATLKDFFKGSLDTKIYGILGPCLYLKPYLYDEISYPPFDFDLGGGIGAGLAFKVEILDWKLAEYNYAFIDYTKSFYHSTNSPPNTPSTPSGPSSGYVDSSYNFSSSAIDPDGDDIAIRFAWDDGDTSSWSSYVPSGNTVSMSHSWSSASTYYITAEARDMYGALSNWSSGHQIVVNYDFPSHVVDSISVGGCQHVTILPNGDYLYVSANSSSPFVPDSVYVIRTSNNTIVTSVGVGDYPHGVVALPNGNYVYVANYHSEDVSVIRTSDNSVVDTIPIGYTCYRIAALHNCNYLYVTSPSSGRVYVIRLSDNIVIDTIWTTGGAKGIATLPNDEFVYVGTVSWFVQVIRTSDNTIIESITVRNDNTDIVALPNGNYVYVSSRGVDSVSVIRTSDNTVIETIAVGGGPEGIAVLPNGDYVYVANRGSGDVTVIRTIDNTVVATIPLGYQPKDIAVHPSGNCVYVTTSDGYVKVIGF